LDHAKTLARQTLCDAPCQPACIAASDNRQNLIRISAVFPRGADIAPNDGEFQAAKNRIRQVGGRLA
jgi:hypothetical protein